MSDKSKAKKLSIKDIRKRVDAFLAQALAFLKDAKYSDIMPKKYYDELIAGAEHIDDVFFYYTEAPHAAKVLAWTEEVGDLFLAELKSLKTKPEQYEFVNLLMDKIYEDGKNKRSKNYKGSHREFLNSSSREHDGAVYFRNAMTQILNALPEDYQTDKKITPDNQLLLSRATGSKALNFSGAELTRFDLVEDREEVPMEVLRKMVAGGANIQPEGMARLLLSSNARQILQMAKLRKQAGYAYGFEAIFNENKTEIEKSLKRGGTDLKKFAQDLVRLGYDIGFDDLNVEKEKALLDIGEARNWYLESSCLKKRYYCNTDHKLKTINLDKKDLERLGESEYRKLDASTLYDLIDIVPNRYYQILRLYMEETSSVIADAAHIMKKLPAPSGVESKEKIAAYRLFVEKFKETMSELRKQKAQGEESLAQEETEHAQKKDEHRVLEEKIKEEKSKREIHNRYAAIVRKVEDEKNWFPEFVETFKTDIETSARIFKAPSVVLAGREKRESAARLKTAVSNYNDFILGPEYQKIINWTCAELDRLREEMYEKFDGFNPNRKQSEFRYYVDPSHYKPLEFFDSVTEYLQKVDAREKEHKDAVKEKYKAKRANVAGWPKGIFENEEIKELARQIKERKTFPNPRTDHSMTKPKAGAIKTAMKQIVKPRKTAEEIEEHKKKKREALVEAAKRGRELRTRGKKHKKKQNPTALAGMENLSTLEQKQLQLLLAKMNVK